MQELRKKKRLKKFVYSKTAALTLVVMCGFLANAAYHVYTKSKESSALALEATKELKELESKQETLNENIVRLQTTEGKEEEVRSKFNVTKPDEKLVVIVDDEPTSTPKEVEKSWWDSVKSFFIKK